MNEPKPNPNGFTDPYGHLSPAEKTRTTIDVSTAARAVMSSVYPKKGYLQTTCNILIEKLCHELKRCGLTDSGFAPEQYELAVSGCSIKLGGVEYDANGNPAVSRSSVRKSPSRRKSPCPTETPS